MRSSPCGRCGEPFPKSRWGYCETCRTLPAVQHRNASRTGPNALTRRPGTFIGVDGEGYTRPDGTHHYTMLSVGDATLTDPDGDHLTFETIMPFLWEQFEANPTASFVGFFLGYDFTHWTATLPAAKAYKLWHKEGRESRKPKLRKDPTAFPVDYKGWEFDMLNNVRFRLRPEGDKRWMFICDVGPYFQASFLSVINPAQWTDPVCTPEEHRILVAGKEARADVQTPQEWVALYDETARYNRTENRILAAVMDRMKTGLVAEKIELNRDQWFGPGQAAEGWLRSIGQPTGEAVRSATPIGAQDAAQASYYGGWFEILAHGHLAGETYEYDINSAYPAAMTHLPCLVHGAWKHRLRGSIGHPYTLMNVRVTGSHPLVGAMSCRRPDGTIARPHETEGWYWAHELLAARNAGFIDTIQSHGAWEYTPAICPGSFDHTVTNMHGKQVTSTYNCNAIAENIPKIYQRRLEVGKNSPHGKALKIVYNSAYGKFAQSIGKPKFGNAFAASYITSWCRTRILEAIATHPSRADSLVMVATDGVYFREPHPGLDTTPGVLGAWEASVKTNLTLLKPGVYWDDKARESLAEGKLPSLKSRGISTRDLAVNLTRIDEEFNSEEFRQGFHWPYITLTRHFNHVSARSAITRGAWETAGQIGWQDGIAHQPMTRIEAATPQSKRDVTGEPWTDPRGDLRLPPYPLTHAGGVSEPYSEKFGRMLEEDPRFNDPYETSDGGGDYTDILRSVEPTSTEGTIDG